MIGSPAFYVEAPLRWVALLALAALLGALALDAVVLPRGRPEAAGARRRLAGLRALAVVVLLAASAGTLLARARTMTGGGLAEAAAALPLVLGRTHFGAVWIARFAALGALVLLAWPRARRARALALPATAAVALTTALTGHAADHGDLSLAVLVDWIHALAGGVWGGGLLGLTLAVFADRAAWPPRLFAEVARRFSRLAGWCLLLVVATGLYNAWVEVPALAALWTTGYGRALVLKTALVLALAALGAFNRWALLPGLDDAGTRARLAGVVGREALLVVLVFACTAVLGESTPRRHPHHPGSAAAVRVAILKGWRHPSAPCSSTRATRSSGWTTGSSPRRWAGRASRRRPARSSAPSGAPG